jgi:hypothetical protein
MTDHNSDQQKREQRKRQLDEVSRILGEALVAHSMTDQESEEAMLAIAVDDHLTDQQVKLQRLWDVDAVGMAAFGDDDGWVDRRLGSTDGS